MTEQEAARKFYIVTACMIPWVGAYSGAVVCFAPGWLAAFNVVAFFVTIGAIGRNLV